MRFIRKQIVLTTIADENIVEIDTIKKVLESLSKSSVDISIDFVDPSIDFTKSYSSARISKISEEKIDIIVRNNKNILHVKDIEMKNILSVKIITDQNNIFIGKNNSDFDMLDISKS